MISLRDLIESESSAAAPVILPEAQAHELALRYEEAHIHSNLLPGDIVVEKQGMGYMPERKVCVLWALLDINSYHHRLIIKDWYARIAIGELDCLVGLLNPRHNTAPEGMKLIIQPHSLRMLEKFKQ